MTVTDANSRQAINTFSLKVNSAVTATQSVPAKILTQNFAAPGFTPVTGGGGTTPLTYSISPTLTTGLSINPSTGAITGAPANGGAPVTYTVTVTDANSAAASNTFQMAVNTPVTAFQSIPSKALTQNRAAAGFTPVMGGGGVAPVVYNVLAYSADGIKHQLEHRRSFRYTPSATSPPTPYVVSVTDSNGATASSTLHTGGKCSSDGNAIDSYGNLDAEPRSQLRASDRWRWYESTGVQHYTDVADGVEH